MSARRAGRPALLVLRALGLGDLLAGVPALRALRRAFPDHHLVLAAPENLREAAEATGAVDALFPAYAPGRGVPDLRHWPGPPPQIAVDLHGTGFLSREALAVLAPERLLAYAPPPGRPAVLRPRRPEHERERWCRLLRAHGVPADSGDLLLAPPRLASLAPDAVVVHPGADAAARRWPAERYAEVAATLARRGHRVVVTGGPGEDALVGAVADAAGIAPRDVFAGGLPFPRLSALIASARLLISGDTGPAHLAAAHAVPSVTLFGPVPPSAWGPPPLPRHAALWHTGPPGDPHGTVPDPQLLRITVDEVLTAAANRLPPPGAASAGSAAPGAPGRRVR
ncbi:glycosyltransferase family 9 protein [Streptomyces albidoflavus]|uniref:glycosyltransferase family 9 protein n=1 Tax=Streptomyces TaxID=1883 RepID=UPI000691206E|nr:MULTISPECIES: glycosyltransferase family 9 protein [unclassified Streptomyces]MCG5121079.1 glycosyltransferase family 9 protein [Streptomyces sp. T7(2022)]MCK2139585.1 glycosyltransferase family 9 protein [Streptomyces sp. WAC00276]MCQ9707645.1 glycosyltransferase family 9 protein [Streptomyces sp. BSP1]QDD57518.1 glycosyltransferase family 9 protein [Streptomyces albidoflavus]